MAAIPGGSFDSNKVGEMRVFDALPEGDYLLRITESEMHPTNAGDGEYLKITFDVMTPGFEGRKIFNNLNLNNPNPKAVEIAGAELGAICKAVGKPVIQDSVELHGIPMMAHVKFIDAKPAVEPNPAQGIKGSKARPADNRITEYSPATGGGSVAAASPVAAAAAPQAEAAAVQTGAGGASGVKPPWA